ncbi:hypothetical protein [Actinophytocola gossypii]|uniref:Uncharacterized protein n=1 Tax=Actinophytocola gossypii TaxID=2812003 RepID=A0ABT2JK64_9PSEU|nr:hypothetical protein [Actinophytocola gossypii]MCT2588277.1 hypothetical protein [Actinophytocola gossypii]
MNQPSRRFTTQNQQGNNASGSGTVYSVQNGNQRINNTTNNNLNVTNNNTFRQARSRAGWAVLVILAVDVAFFFYGQAAYTGRTGDSGDLWRAGIFLVLMLTTGTLVRRWFRSRW